MVPFFVVFQHPVPGQFAHFVQAAEQPRIQHFTAVTAVSKKSKGPDSSPGPFLVLLEERRKLPQRHSLDDADAKPDGALHAHDSADNGDDGL